jgi:predicted phage terminase large subunit-like protein
VTTLELVQTLSDAEWADLSRELLAWFPTGRPEQKPRGDWLVYAFVAGRGAGKTRSGAEWIVDKAITMPGNRGAIVAPTSADVRDTCIEGESGVEVVARRRLPGLDWDRVYNRTMAEIDLPNGSRIKGFSAEKPERLRGPQHHYAWADELAVWPTADAWDQLQFGLRLGERPCTVVTTTPRPTRLVRRLRDRADREDAVVWVGGSTFDNAENLSAAALAELRAQYEGTRIGRQELYAELLLDTPGALWTLEGIERDRRHEHPPLRRVVVAIDPAVTTGEDSDATGIVAAGVDFAGDCWVLDDATCRLSPEQWARRAIDLYDTHAGDRIVAEVNNGGDLVATVLRTVDPSVPVRSVHASRGKRVRAEPVAALYEQGKVHHVGVHAALEEQMTTWTPEATESPDRLDALVWAITDLAIEPAKRRRRSIVGVA